MAVNTRFATGVHTLVLLAAEPELQQTSDEIAKKLNANPVVIRRVLSLLRQAGLVGSQKGPTGGTKLAKPPKAIRLGDIYRALEPSPVLHAPSNSGDQNAKLSSLLEKTIKNAQAALELELDGTTLAQFAKKSEKGDKKKK